MKIIAKHMGGEFRVKFGQRYTHELEILFANCNLAQQEKLRLIDFIERAFEHGKNSTHSKGIVET